MVASLLASSAATAPASPWIATSAGLTRPSIRWSASTWMMRASSGQYSMPYWGNVPKGPNRVPSARITSARATMRIAALEPW